MTIKENVEEEEAPLSPMARLMQMPNIDSCIIAMIGFKTKINLDLILDDLKHNVSKHPRFCSKPSDDGATWIKTKVNVEDHVYAPEIDPQETNEDGQAFVDDYISGLTMIPLDRSRPMWDIHILNVKTSDAEAVGVVRCHHSLGDGVSLMSLLVACTRKTSDPEAFPTIPTIKRREPYHLRNEGNFLRSMFVIHSYVILIWNTIVDFIQRLACGLFLKDTEIPLRQGDHIKNNLDRFYHRTVSLDDIRLIKNAMNMTINDVLLGVTQAALSRYLNGRYGGTSTSDQNNLPGRIRHGVTIPVNLRQETGIQPVANMLAKDSQCRWGNYVSSLHFPMSISLKTDPLVNLSKTKSIMDRKKHSLLASLLYSSQEFIINTFGPKVGEVIVERPRSNTTTFVSNIVGPVEDVSLHGNQIAYIALSCYGNGPKGLLIHFISYAEKLIISIRVDPTVIPDPHHLCDEMEESLKAIKDALSRRSNH
ncbi:unnamed protein product [Microthlaspi erraticum]|uniref:Uncharacterized protein n=1 Tax=Microthlaspi erraticum TaxID=1685480 RepID=A0A6D2KIF9_9BRAS|nr:unnamed protein product [Microthlaspi erraticum]